MRPNSWFVCLISEQKMSFQVVCAGFLNSTIPHYLSSCSGSGRWIQLQTHPREPFQQSGPDSFLSPLSKYLCLTSMSHLDQICRPWLQLLFSSLYIEIFFFQPEQTLLFSCQTKTGCNTSLFFFSSSSFFFDVPSLTCWIWPTGICPFTEKRTYDEGLYILNMPLKYHLSHFLHFQDVLFVLNKPSFKGAIEKFIYIYI